MANEKHSSKLGQDLLDVVLQKYGTLEGGLENFVQLNPSLDLGVDLTSGQEVNIAPDGVGDVNNKEFFKNNLNVLNNADGKFVAVLGTYCFQDGQTFCFQDGEAFDYN